MTPIDQSTRKAVILLSGGLDSATVLAIARNEGFACHTLSFDYGQRHACELDAAKRLSEAFQVVEHVVIPLDLSRWGGSALTTEMEVPKDREKSHLSGDIPVTYVPARNTVFLSLALAWAEVLGSFDIFIGANAVDYSGYPDCRPEFIEQFERLANLATKAGVEGTGKFHVHTPLLLLKKSEIIQKGTQLGLDYGLTRTCYDPLENGKPCRRCDACQLREKGFTGAGFTDPLLVNNADE